jgi:hypothetical protein
MSSRVRRSLLGAGGAVALADLPAAGRCIVGAVDAGLGVSGLPGAELLGEGAHAFPIPC